MGHSEDNGPALPPKIKAAFDFLHHARMVTEQSDASIPVRGLTPLEKSVETAALRAVQQYLLGEMDFVEDAPPAPPKKRSDEDPGAQPVKAMP